MESQDLPSISSCAPWLAGRSVSCVSVFPHTDSEEGHKAAEGSRTAQHSATRKASFPRDLAGPTPLSASALEAWGEAVPNEYPFDANTEAWRGGPGGGGLFSSSRLFSDISNAGLPWKLQEEKNEKANHYHPSCHQLCSSEKFPEHPCGRSKTRTGQRGRGGSVGNGGTVKVGPQPFREKRRHDKGEKKNLRQKSDPQGQGQLRFFEEVV